jgi:hypothetical protein
MNCKTIIHPFQNDPGVSQSQRVMDDLLNSKAEIDGRSTADLLDYFMKLSPHINFYDEDKSIKNWKPFFEKSQPFTLTSIIKYNQKSVDDKLYRYNNLFAKKPTKQSLQLLLQFVYNNLIVPVNKWEQQFKNSNLPIELLLSKTIKDKLKQSVKQFIIVTNTAVKWYCISALNFDAVLKNEAWNLDITDIYANYNNVSFKALGRTKRERLVALQQEINTVAIAFSGAIQIFSDTAALSMDQAFFPLKEDFKKLHPPHLAILFSFLKLFRHLQNDMNGFTKKHLDFFYKNVLKLQAKEAVADKAHIVFEIQKQLDKYLLKKGLLLKDGKDNNKVEILFAIDEEIVVNKTQIAEKRTLFLSNNTLDGSTCLEGVYMTTNAEKADGVEKVFEDTATASWHTIGAKYSKFIDPENKFIKPYPNARIGFVLASPVLLLNEGRREIIITLNCEVTDNYCASVTTQTSNNKACCEENNLPGTISPALKPVYPNFGDATSLVKDIADKLNETFYYINRESIAEALKKGASKETHDKLLKLLIKQELPGEEKLYEITIPAKTTSKQIGYENIFSADERLLMADIIKPIKILNVAFSGADEWIYPKPDESKANEFLEIKMVPAVAGSTNVTITIKATITPDQKAITFYDAKKLKEDIGNDLPIVKIELDDRIKLFKSLQGTEREGCCERKPQETNQAISLYHFFRNVIVLDSSKIDVKVCGVKNLIVQNDENIENVNSLVHPFSVRPKVGANFYIGNKEIFMKQWKELWINVEWKDRPKDFEDFYKHYTYELFEDGSSKIVNSSFKLNYALLENGNWRTDGGSDLFTHPKLNRADYCTGIPQAQWFEDVYNIKSTTFAPAYAAPIFDKNPLTQYTVNSRYSFLRLTLGGVGFQHDRYAFVLTRHIMALSNLVDPISIKFAQDFTVGAKSLIAAINLRVTSIQSEITLITNEITSVLNNDINHLVNGLLQLVVNLNARLTNANSLLALATPNVAGAIIEITNAISIKTQINNKVNAISTKSNSINNSVTVLNNLVNADPVLLLDLGNLSGVGLKRLSDELKSYLDKISDLLKVNNDLKTGLPREPYTPAIKTIYIDYTATAENNDIELIHLYPYAGTYKKESIAAQQPRTYLFPTFCDEGTLFIGLKDLQPGSNVNMLFQLAEATADSEAKKENVQWYYLENNDWKILRPGFEVLDDDTDGLTTSGIVKFALPANMTNENSILPKGLHWIKATIPQNSKTVSETIGIFTQAIKATFTKAKSNDTLRLNAPLSAGSLAKLQEADSAIKKTTQPFDSFGGRQAEAEGHFYVRVSELLRHKGRAIQKFDYERLVLEAFPQIFKVKCVTHSFALNAHKYINDIPLAPGYVLLAAIPDLNQLKAAQQFEPKLPVSILENIEEYLRMRTSPFVRIKAMNPRYEKVHFCLKVKLYLGKDENFYKEKLQQDLREFLAPWAVGVYDKLRFGQCIYESDIVQFLETLNYLDYMIELKMQHEDDEVNLKPKEQYSICPITPRSILIAGKIDICIVQQDCEKWNENVKPCKNQPMPLHNFIELKING